MTEPLWTVDVLSDGEQVYPATTVRAEVAESLYRTVTGQVLTEQGAGDDREMSVRLYTVNGDILAESTCFAGEVLAEIDFL